MYALYAQTACCCDVSQVQTAKAAFRHNRCQDMANDMCKALPRLQQAWALIEAAYMLADCSYTTTHRALAVCCHCLSAWQVRRLQSLVWCLAAGLFPFRTQMTKDKMKMGYIEVETQQGCNLFPPHCKARGHVYHYSEILQEKIVGGFHNGRHKELEWETGYQATMQVSLPIPLLPWQSVVNIVL